MLNLFQFQTPGNSSCSSVLKFEEILAFGFKIRMSVNLGKRGLFLDRRIAKNQKKGILFIPNRYHIGKFEENNLKMVLSLL